MEEIITKYINKWDPIGILIYNPNEYDIEISEICKRLSKQRNLTEDNLAKVIADVFEEYFGKNNCVKGRSLKDSKKVAKQILAEL